MNLINNLINVTGGAGIKMPIKGNGGAGVKMPIRGSGGSGRIDV